LLCRCPRCGHGRIFKGVLQVNFRCRACGLDLTRLDIGDGVAFGLILLWGVVLAGLGAVTEYAFAPSYWFHVMVWPTAYMALVFVTVRPIKAGLIALGYFYRVGKIRL